MHQRSETPRAPNVTAESRRNAMAVAGPFLGSFEGWNERLAFLKARLESPVATDSEREVARMEIGEMLSEVEAAKAAFERASANQPAHSRLDDTRAVYARLIANLKSAWFT